MLRAFVRNEQGNIALIYGLGVLPLLGFAGAALDYSRATDLRSFLRAQADMAATALAVADMPNTDAVLADLRAAALSHFGTGPANPVRSVTATSSWAGSNVTVRVEAAFASAILSAVPGMPKTMSISIESEVKRKAAQWQWNLPTVSNLSYEAGDYNRISVYCYDPSKKNEPGKGRRLETLTAISDNGGTDYSAAAMPTCNSGETLSYQLRNVRNARTTPSKWNDSLAEHYLYFTDTTIDQFTRVMTNTVTGGREFADGSITYTDLLRAPLLETILCDTRAACTSKVDGGILPNNHETGRNPATATAGCAEGKYMYYGWEDRPPTTSTASDRDYDDIRLVVSCPTLVKVADKEVRIVR